MHNTDPAHAIHDKHMRQACAPAIGQPAVQARLLLLLWNPGQERNKMQEPITYPFLILCYTAFVVVILDSV